MKALKFAVKQRKVQPRLQFDPVTRVRRFWTDDEDNQIIALYLEGRSRAYIGKQLGTTKNSIIGRLNRLKKMKRLPHERNSPTVVNNLKSTKTTQELGVKLKVAKFAPTLYKAVEALERDSCSFPVGETSDPSFRFCCKPKRPGSSYCSEHHALCWRPVPDGRWKSQKDISR